MPEKTITITLTINLPEDVHVGLLPVGAREEVVQENSTGQLSRRKCPICGKFFKRLGRHLAACKKPDGPSPVGNDVECQYCGRKLPEEALEGHSRRCEKNPAATV